MQLVKPAWNWPARLTPQGALLAGPLIFRRAVVPVGGWPMPAVQEALADSPELVAGELVEEGPGEVERGVDGAALRSLVDEPLLEVVGEGEIAAVVLAQHGGCRR